MLGAPAVIAHLVDTARSFIFDTGLNPAAAGAALAAAGIVSTSPELSGRVLRRAAALAAAAGVPESGSAVVPVVIGDAAAARDLAAALRDRGVHVGCFRPPSVPAGTARLRVTARADLTDADIELFGRALAALRPPRPPTVTSPGEIGRRGCTLAVVVVTGTGTDVGKTVVTAAVAATALAASRTVAVVKPVQTGLPPAADGDLADVHRLSGATDRHEFRRYPDPLAPATAARRTGDPGPGLTELASAVLALTDRDLVLVEGAGGLLVRFNAAGQTLSDLAAELGSQADVGVLLVASAGLGVLNSAALTAQALRAAGLPLLGTVIGCWPDAPDLAARCNAADLADYTGAPLLGALPAGAGALGRTVFTVTARHALSPLFGGDFDAADFIRRTAAPVTADGSRKDHP